jgi:hypothetical protein
MIRGEIIPVWGGGECEVTAFPVETPSFKRNELPPVASKYSNLTQAITFPIYFKDAKFWSPTGHKTSWPGIVMIFLSPANMPL